MLCQVHLSVGKISLVPLKSFVKAIDYLDYPELSIWTESTLFSSIYAVVLLLLGRISKTGFKEYLRKHFLYLFKLKLKIS